MGKLLTFLLTFFAPPPEGAGPEKQYPWQYKVSTTLGCMVVFMVSYVLGAAGMFPMVTLGYATVKNLKSSEELWKEMRRDQLDTKLFDTRGRQCAALKGGNRQALESETKRLQANLVDYNRVSDMPWRIPTCDEY